MLREDEGRHDPRGSVDLRPARASVRSVGAARLRCRRGGLGRGFRRGDGRSAPKVEAPVVDLAVAEIEQIEEVVLTKPPWLLGALFREQVNRAFDVACL